MGARWRHALTLLGIGPLLLLQGRYVRRVTPRLPEAAGARNGQVGNGEPLRLLIAGDSAAAGVGAARQHQALAGQLSQALSRDFTVNWQLWAGTGDTAEDLLRRLKRSEPAQFDIAVISIGVNDVTANRPLKQWLGLIDAIITQLRSHPRARQVVFCALPPMHLFPALPQPLRWYLGQRALSYNQGLAKHLRNRDHVHLVSPDYPDNADMIASDGFHPGPAAYAHWGEGLARALRQCAGWAADRAD